MDQTKFINSYINNLAEQLKSMTLDNIMIKTQLNIANDTIVQLQKELEKFKPADDKKSDTKSEWTKENIA
jgi:hypothetical protein